MSNRTLGYLGLATRVNSVYNAATNFSSCIGGNIPGTFSDFIVTDTLSISGATSLAAGLQTSLTLGFTGEGSQFSRIKSHNENYSWSSNNTAVATVQSYSGNIATIYGVAAGSCNITCTYNDGGFNGHLTQRSYLISVTSGGGGGCLVVGTPVIKSDGSDVPIESVLHNDNLKSFYIPGMIDESVNGWKSWQTKDISGGLSTNSIIVNNKQDISNNTYLINNSLHITAEHPVFVKRYHLWEWIHAGALLIGDKALGIDENEIEITSVEKVPGTFNVITLDVENVDNYFAGSLNGVPILLHNAAKV